MQDRVRPARQKLSQHGSAGLIALLIPAIGFPAGIWLLADEERFRWIGNPAAFPWQFWVVAVFGTVATAAGIIDYRIHRSGATVVGRSEHQAHVAALAGGGLPLFALLAAASLISSPGFFLIPVLIALIATVVLICYDEFRFHRRCGQSEVLAHRTLTIGNGIAFLAWAHWCFARGADHG